MMSKQAIVLLAMLLTLQGCATTQESNTSRFWGDGGFGKMQYKDYQIEIISEPSGAKIEVDNNYIGETPLIYTGNGDLGPFNTVVVKAYPTEIGQYTQTKILSGKNILPRKLYFDMRLVPASNDVNVNIN